MNPIRDKEFYKHKSINKKYLSMILLIAVSLLNSEPIKCQTIEHNSSNLICNGDFKKTWEVCWQRVIGDINKGCNRIRVELIENKSWLHLYHKGNLA